MLQSASRSARPGYSAVVLGGSGAVGTNVLRELMRSSHCSKITSIGRRKIEMNPSEQGYEKLFQETVENMDDIQNHEELFKGHQVAFCTLGVGEPSKLSLAEVEKIEAGYTGKFAEVCKKSGVQHISFMTAVGADTKSKMGLARIKGVAEENFAKLNFERCSFFRPSVLVTKEIRYGFQDKVVQFLFPKISWMLPSRYEEITVEDLGKSIRINADLNWIQHSATTDDNGNNKDNNNNNSNKGIIEILHHNEFVALLRREHEVA